MIDLSERDPVAALEWCHLLGDTPYRIVVAGGDGTVAWLLDAIHKLQLNVTKKNNIFYFNSNQMK